MLTVSKLSRNQKAILECLHDSYTEPGLMPGGYWCHVRKLSWFVARRFNKGHGDKIWDPKQAKAKMIEEFKQETRDCFNEQGKFVDEKAERKANMLAQEKLLLSKIIDSAHKRALLTGKHRASFSRSLKRLEQRGLIECYVALKTENRDGTWTWVWYGGDGRTVYAALTDRGLKYILDPR